MTIYCNPQEAKGLAKSELHTGQELPRNLNFTATGNHLAAAVLFAAQGAPEQIFNLRQLYAAFRVRSPKEWEEGEQRSIIRAYAKSHFDAYEEQASDRLRSGASHTLLDGLQFASANEWKFDNEVVTTYAIDSSGRAAAVMRVIGFVNPQAVGTRNRLFMERILEDTQFAIDREF